MDLAIRAMAARLQGVPEAQGMLQQHGISC